MSAERMEPVGIREVLGLASAPTVGGNTNGPVVATRIWTADQILAAIEEVRADSHKRACGWTITQADHHAASDALDALRARLGLKP